MGAKGELNAAQAVCKPSLTWVGCIVERVKYIFIHIYIYISLCFATIRKKYITSINSAFFLDLETMAMTQKGYTRFKRRTYTDTKICIVCGHDGQITAYQP